MTFVLDPHFFSLAWLKFLSRVIHCISDWISFVVGLVKSWPELAFPSHRFPSALIQGSSAWAPGNNQGVVGGALSPFQAAPHPILSSHDSTLKFKASLVSVKCLHCPCIDLHNLCLLSIWLMVIVSADNLGSFVMIKTFMQGSLRWLAQGRCYCHSQLHLEISN